MMHRPAMISARLAAAILLAACNSDGGSGAYYYDDWLYHHDAWYDDDFWIWADDHPDCCDDQDDLKQALQDWYQGLDPDQQQAVADRVGSWLDEHGIAPAAGQSPRDLVLDTAAERWTALTPDERQQWIDQRHDRIERRQATGSLSAGQRDALRERAAGLDPEQYAALRESGQAASLLSRSGGAAQRSISHHPVPSRAGSSSRGSFSRSGGGRGRGGGGRR